MQTVVVIAVFKRCYVSAAVAEFIFVLLANLLRVARSRYAKKGKATKGLSSQTLHLQLQLHPHSPLTYLTNPIHPINCCYIQFRPTVMNRKWKDDEFIGPKNGPLWIIIFLSFSAESIAGCSAGVSLRMHCRSFLISPIELNPGRCRSYARVPANYNRTIECSFTLHCWLVPKSVAHVEIPTQIQPTTPIHL